MSQWGFVATHSPVCRPTSTDMMHSRAFGAFVTPDEAGDAQIVPSNHPSSPFQFEIGYIREPDSHSHSWLTPDERYGAHCPMPTSPLIPRRQTFGQSFRQWIHLIRRCLPALRDWSFGSTTRSPNMVFTQSRGFVFGASFGLQICSLRCRVLVCHAADTGELQSHFASILIPSFGFHCT